MIYQNIGPATYRVLHFIARQFEESAMQLLTSTERRVIEKRHAAIWILRKVFALDNQRIASVFNSKYHTVRSAIITIDTRAFYDLKFRERLGAAANAARIEFGLIHSIERANFIGLL